MHSFYSAKRGASGVGNPSQRPNQRIIKEPKLNDYKTLLGEPLQKAWNERFQNCKLYNANR